MCEVDKITSQLLEISKQLASSSKSFHFTLKTKDVNFSFSSKDRDYPSKDPEKPKKKSPSQKNRDFERRKQFLEKKSDESSFTKKLSENTSGDKLLIEDKHDIQYKCKDCDYITNSKKGLQIHIGKQHKISGQIDGMDDTDLKEDTGVQTDDSLSLVLTGEIGEDCEEHYIGETFWNLPDGFFYDHWHTESIRRAPKDCWVNKSGIFRNRKTGDSCGRVT